MAKKIFVGNLSFQTSENDLNDLFAQFGEVESVSIITDRDTGADPRAWPGWVRRRVDRSSENDASSAATRKSLLLTSKSEMLTRKSLFLTSKSEMLARKSLFLIGKVKRNKNHSRLFIVSSKILDTTIAIAVNFPKRESSY